MAHLPDPACRGAAWVGPITALDIWSGIYDLNGLAGADQFKQAIATASPPAPASPAADATGRPAAAAPHQAALVLPSALAGLAGDIGSNAYGLGRDATTRGDGMLLANPHFPWTGYGRFYQVQLTIRGVLDVSGASLYGTPVVEIGHTQGLAWTHTVSTAHRFTLYQLKLVPGHPTSYLVDGRPEQMTSRVVTVTVRDSDGRLSTVTRKLYSTRYGPVLTLGGATGWSAASGAATATRSSRAYSARAACHG